MVEFEEIKDEHYEANDGFEDEEDGSDGDYSDASDDDDQAQDEDVQDETIIDRIVALKDIIPAHQRDAISRSISKAYSFGSMATFIGGKAVYILITSILMLGIPYALSLEEDKMISEQERQMQLQQGMSEVPSLLFLDRCLISRFLRPPLPRLWLPRLQNLNRRHQSVPPVSEHSERYLWILVLRRMKCTLLCTGGIRRLVCKGAERGNYLHSD
jgi:import receptor subunit TOM22